MAKERFSASESLDPPKGFKHRIHFKSLATMNRKTGDGRLLETAGRGVRDLPRTIYAQFAQAIGHEGAVVVGRLDTVEFDTDTGNIEGWGWLLDDENGNLAARYAATKAMSGNSVDLAEVKVRFRIDDDADDADDDDDDGFAPFFEKVTIAFTEWKIAATTLLGKPAFADAEAEVEMSDEEITASYVDGCIEIDAAPVTLTFAGDEINELVASMTADETVVPWADFHIPEADHPQKIVVDAEGRVYGHLALWDQADQQYLAFAKPPRPSDNYASFNQSGPLTERGPVETGPIFFANGHPDKPLGGQDPFKAYGGVENAWADVRVTEGRFGPWISGRVRPGVSPETLYAARASRISGHWVGDALRAIVSCNVARFNVPGSGFSELTDWVTFNEDGKMAELVASFPPMREPKQVIESATPPSSVNVYINLSGYDPVTYSTGTVETTDLIVDLSTETTLEVTDDEADDELEAEAFAAVASMALEDD